MCVATYYVIMRKSATVISQTKCRIGVCVKRNVVMRKIDALQTHIVACSHLHSTLHTLTNPLNMNRILFFAVAEPENSS